jgi:hypothetical protein
MSKHRKIWVQHHPEDDINGNYVIHHINGNRDDNRIENLQKMSMGEHAKHHNTGKVGTSHRAGAVLSDESKAKIADKMTQSWVKDRESRSKQLTEARAKSKKDPDTGRFS